MRIKRILSQHRRDFRAIYKCEHCDAEQEGSGYDDDNFHQNVIPKMVCAKCGKIASDNYVPVKTKYAAGVVI
jgi:hypothetical protein